MQTVILLLRALGLAVGVVVCLPLMMVNPALAMHMGAKCHDMADELERWERGE